MTDPLRLFTIPKFGDNRNEMDIKTLELGDMAANCYLVSTEVAALVIDPGTFSDKAEKFLLQNREKHRLILLTHAHFDHIGGALQLRESTETEIAVGINENASLPSPNINLSVMFGADLKPFNADILLRDNTEITVGDLKILPLEAPGHTVGGMCYLINGMLFSGDTLFYGSVGRTDFPGGSAAALTNSVKRLYSLLPGDTAVMPGHGRETTIGFEKKYNMFVKE